MDVPIRVEQDVTSADSETDSCRHLGLSAHNKNLFTETLDEATKQLNCSRPIAQSCSKTESSTRLEETVEVIKVYLEPNRLNQDKDHSVTMLTDEVSQIQEVRYCLKSLREQMAARHKNNNQLPVNGIQVNLSNRIPQVSNTSEEKAVTECQEQECLRLKELTKHLHAQLQEMEKRHQEEKEALQAENQDVLQRLEVQNKQPTQSKVEGQNQQNEELQRRLGDLQLENVSLREKLAESEAELQELRALKNEELENRCKGLEKDLVIQKERNYQLDDMLKSQQRKVRMMIEQLQNSQTIMADRERLIQDLEEKLTFLEAENREMRDRMEFSLGESCPNKEAQIVYSKPLTPTSPGNKSLPFIKVIEIKS